MATHSTTETYSRINSKLWTGRTGRALRAIGPDAFAIAAYLISGPQINALGLYYLPLEYVAKGTGVKAPQIESILAAMKSIGFAEYDYETEIVWIVKMARFQIGTLLPKDHRVKWANKMYQDCPDTHLLGPFFDMYKSDLRLEQKRLALDVTGREIAPIDPTPDIPNDGDDDGQGEFFDDVPESSTEADAARGIPSPSEAMNMNNNMNNNKLKTIKPTAASGLGFEPLWTEALVCYKRAGSAIGNKQEALKEFAKVKDVTVEVMIEALQKQSIDKQRAKMKSEFAAPFKNFNRWLKHKCWTDETTSIETKARSHEDITV